jgi:hypothetical protein
MDDFEDFLEEEKKPHGLVPVQSGHPYGGHKVFQRKGFDPLESLVETSMLLSKEITYQLKRRNGSIKELRTDGKEKAFMHEHLMVPIAAKISADKELLKYAYAKVPDGKGEEDPSKKKTKSFAITLTKDGDTFSPKMGDEDDSEV